MRYWKRIDGEGATTTVESYSHDLDIEGAVEITKEEYDAYIASLPPLEPPPEPRDFGAEIDEITAKMVVSIPPGGMTKIANVYHDPTTKEMVCEET